MAADFTPFHTSCSRYEMVLGSVRVMALLVVGCVLELACGVEPPPLPALVDGGGPSPDAGPPDASPRDGGVFDCRPEPNICPTDQFCDSDGRCQPFDRECNSSEACASGDVCVIGPTSTSTVYVGRCGSRPGGCTNDTDCHPDGACWAIGLCGPRATSAEVVSNALQPLAHCTRGPDCGPAGVCRNQRCAPCIESSDCSGQLRCGEDGRCVEASSCIQDTACFPGNVCATGSRCARRTEGCEPDLENNSSATAQEIGPGVYEERSICGNDEDWYTVKLTEGQGVRFVIVTRSDAFTPEVTVQDSAGDGEENVSRLALPGRVAIDISGANLGGQGLRTIVVGVASRDQSGFYTLHVDLRPAACSADTLDLYGDEPPLAVPTNVEFTRRLCPGEADAVTFDVETGDVVTAATTIQHGPPLALSLTGGSTAAQDFGQVSAGPYVGTSSVTLTARLNSVPSSGRSYVVSLDRALGTRAVACQSPRVLLSEQPTQADLGSALDIGFPRCPAGPEGEPGFAVPARRDVVFQLDVPTVPALLTASALQTTGTAAKITVAALTTCANERAVIECGVSPLPRRAADLEFVVNDAGPVFLLVSSIADDENVEFEITAAADPIVTPADDLCVNATVLSGVDRLAVSTYGAANDDQLLDNGVCGSAGTATGPDRFFSLTVPGGRRAAVELYGPIGTFIWAGQRCDLMTATCTAAQARDNTHPIPRLTFSPRFLETYFIAVDGVTAQDFGRSTLRVIEDAECLEDEDCTAPAACDDYACRPPPANDNCPGEVVNLDGNGFARLFGSTGAASDGLRLSCIADSNLPDVAYQVLVPRGSTEFTARVVDATFDPAIAVRFGLCSSEAGETCFDDLNDSGAFLPEVRLEEPTPGTYYVVVDSMSGRGAFTLDIEVR